MTGRWLWWLLSIVLGVCGGAVAHAEEFRFALFGDTPYSEQERAKLPAMFKTMALSNLDFAVHDGDIKDGGGRCSDELYMDRYQLFQSALFPLIYVPGDNEWTDCHRLFSGLFDPVERLNRLRAIFFSTGESLGKKRLPLERQGDVDGRFKPYRENVRWMRGRVMFVTLNMPGSANNWGKGPSPSPEFVARAKANKAWLGDSFALAHRRRDAVLFVIIQANPDFESFNAKRQNLAYGEFLQQLTELTLGFPGKVVLVHGDTHQQHVDQPMRDPRTQQVMRRFVRIETFGAPYMGWTEITVKNADTSPQLMLTIRPYN